MNEFFNQLQSVVQFLQDNGFEKAAGAIIEQLETQNRDPSRHSEYDYADHQPCVEEEYRSKSAEPVLVSSRAASEAADGVREAEAEGPWASGDAATLTTRLSGSTRLYEDPDLDEYDGMDDLGYLRRCVSNQQEFVLRELEPQESSLEPPYFHHTASPGCSPGQYTNASSTSPLSAGSGSGSSSASLSSPGGVACKQLQQPQHPDAAAATPGAPLQLRSAGSGPCCAPTGDEAWDQGPEGIVLAEPVTTPTKDSRRSSASELKPSLSRVESLSNSFIDELESVDGAGDCGRLSEVGSTAGDMGTPPRRSSSTAAAAGASASDAAAAAEQEGEGCVIDLSPPSPPPDCAADAGIDLSNIFELGLRGSSRTSSVDVLYGSTRCWSETDSEFGCGGNQDIGGSSSGLSRLAWPAAPAAAGTTGGGASSSSGGNQARPGSSSGAAAALAAAGGAPKQRSSLASGSGTSVASIWQPMAPPSQLEEQQQEQALLELLQQQQQGQQAQEASQQGFAGLEAAPLAGDVQQIHTSDSGTSSTAAPETPVSSSEAGAAAASPAAAAGEAGATAAGEAAGEAAGTPPPAAAGAAAGGGGFGFSFPITPPSAVDAAVHEERAERVFSTWASNHSRSGLDAAGASDDEDTGSSKPLLRTVSGDSKAGAAAAQAAAAGAAPQPPQEEPDAYECSWEFPSTPVAAVAPPAAAAAAAEPAAQHAAAAADGVGAAAGGSEPAPVEAAAAAAAAAEPADAGQQAKLSSPFSSSLVPPDLPTGWQSQLQQHKGSSSSGGGIRRVGPSAGGSSSRPHSSAGGSGSRAAVAGRSGGSSSSRHKAAGGSGSRPQSAAAAAPGGLAAAGSPAAAAAGAGSGPRAVRGSPRSTVTEGRSGAGGSASLDALSGFSGLLAGGAAAGDADGASTAGYSSSGELAAAPRYVVDEAGNPLYEYDAKYVEQRYEVFDLRIIHRRRRTGFEDSKEFPVRKNDLIAGRYQVMDFLGSAAFSQAVQALDTASGALVCLKIIKNNKDYFDQSLDEIKLLRYVNGADPDDEHHIVRLYDFFYYKEHLILVCELLRANLYEFQKYQRENGDEPYFTPPRIQAIAVQVLQSLAFLHSLGLVHSDLKPENILIKSYSRCEVKVIDLGSSCFITDHLSSYVQSRSYRAPEVILGLPYGQKVDIWSLGCILAELATGYVLFQNDSLATLLVRLEGILGPLPGWMVGQGRYAGRYYTRSRQIYERNKATGRYELLLPKHTSLRHRVPGADELFLDFLSYLLTPDPQQRPGAEEALQHPWLAHPYPPVEQIPD